MVDHSPIPALTVAAGPSGGVTLVSTGTGLVGGPITTTGTLSLDVSGVTPGTYNSLTVDQYGRVLAGAIVNSAAGRLINVAIVPFSQTWNKQASTNSIEVFLWGGGGGGFASSGGTAQSGGSSSFGPMTAGGGGGATDALHGSEGGTASGGDVNMTGQAGGSCTNSGLGGVGGSAAGGGGGGGANESSGAGNPGGFPGGGGGASDAGVNLFTFFGGGAGYSYKFYNNTAPSSMFVTIGAGGAGGSNGGAGAGGLCIIKEYS